MIKFRKFVSTILVTGALLGGYGVTSLPAQQSTSAEAAAFQPFPGAIAADSITRDMLGQEVVLQGKVVEVFESTAERTPTQLTLVQRDTNPLKVIYWLDTAPLIQGEKGAPKVGTQLSVKGQLTDYKGTLQVRVRSADQIRIDGYKSAAAAPPASTPQDRTLPPGASPPGEDGYYTIKQLSQMEPLLGKKISFKGKVTSYRASWSETAPNIINFKEGSSELEIVYWTSPGDKVADFSKPGTEVYVTGGFAKYRERVQIKVDDLANLSNKPLPDERLADPTIVREMPTSAKDGWPGMKPKTEPVAAAAETAKEGTVMRLRDISVKQEGHMVKVEGAVQRVVTEADGSRAVVIRDQSGFIRVNLPATDKKEYNPGETMSALGKVRLDKLRGAPVIDL